MIKFYFFIFSILFLIGCGAEEETDPITPLQRKVLGYLPYDTWYVSFMNVEELKQTGLWESYFKPSILGKNNNDSFKTFEKETGVSLDNGITNIFTASSKKNRNFFVVVFDKNLKKIKKYFDENLFSFNLTDEKVYKEGKNSKGFFYFINDSTLIVLQDESYLNKLINGENISLLDNKNFLKTIKGISNKNQYWTASNRGNYLINLFEKNFGISKDFSGNKLLRSVKQVTLSASFDNIVRIESEWNCKNSKDAYLLSTAIEGIIAMDLISKSNYELGKILQKTEVQTKNNSINFYLKLNDKSLKDLKKVTRENNIERIL